MFRKKYFTLSGRGRKRHIFYLCILMAIVSGCSTRPTEENFVNNAEELGYTCWKTASSYAEISSWDDCSNDDDENLSIIILNPRYGSLRSTLGTGSLMIYGDLWIVTGSNIDDMTLISEEFHPWAVSTDGK